jgi:hypothetical protein
MPSFLRWRVKGPRTVYTSDWEPWPEFRRAQDSEVITDSVSSLRQFDEDHEAGEGRRRAAQHEADQGFPPRPANQSDLEDSGRSAEDDERSAPRRGRAPETAERNQKKWDKWRKRRNFDDADGDTNAPFAHSSNFFWLLTLGLLLLVAWV